MRRLTAVAALAVALGCQRDPEDLREWVPSDHDNSEQDTPPANQTPDTSDSPSQGQFGIDEVTIVAWRRNCVSCHGQIGRGDGPQGAMVKARDLTDPEWQRSVTDDQIVAVIRQGKGSMPAFPLPENTVEGLVRLIRLLDAGRSQKQPSGQSSAAPPATSGSGPSPAPAPRTSATPPTSR